MFFSNYKKSEIFCFILEIKYLIKWFDYERKDSTWEPFEHLNCEEKLREFQKKHAH